MKIRSLCVLACLFLCPMLAAAGSEGVVPILPLEPKPLEIVPALRHMMLTQELNESTISCAQMRGHYQDAIARFGPQSPKARALTADLQSACHVEHPAQAPAQQGRGGK